MSVIWTKLIECKDEIIEIFNEQATEINEDGLDYWYMLEDLELNIKWQRIRDAQSS